MNQFYEWLYDHYAEPRYDDSQFPAAYQDQKRKWNELSQTLSDHERILILDFLSSVRLHWGTQAFACGVHIGLLLGSELPGEI